MVDLHVHSSYSDGSFSPKELVEYALNHNISAFALTDDSAVVICKKFEKGIDCTSCAIIS